MKYMMIVKHKENKGFPPKELMQAIDKLSVEAVKSGAMLGGGGLKPTESGARVVLANGKVSVVDGVAGAYGFDEAAIEAANKSSFAPATRDGKPVRGWTPEIVYKFQKRR